MCATCGCDDKQWTLEGRLHDGLHGESHWHRHEDGSWHHHAHDAPGHQHDPTHRTLAVEQDILARNDALASGNRRRFADQGVFALNLVSSPGSGKTTLVVETVKAWGSRTPIAVVEGDQQTSLDAERVRAAGVQAVQINTAKGCHLDAQMVAGALERLSLAEESVLLIENVGNLVCPAAFDLGEAHKVVVLSVTEGEDKPLKYPDMFHAADLVLINKADLLPYVDFDLEAAIGHVRRLRPEVEVIVLSARTGKGLDRWLEWLEAGATRAVGARRVAARA